MSELDFILPIEIREGSIFYNIIRKISGYSDIKTILEIGSSSGEGSTKAIVSGMRENTILYCLEVSKVRFAELQKRYKDNPNVQTYNFSSISLNKFPSEIVIRDFYHAIKSSLNKYFLSGVLGWLNQDIIYISTNNIPDKGIQQIKDENNIDIFDMILIDGSEFTGKVELEELYGAKYVLLDDICGYKNFENFQRLIIDSNYELIIESRSTRNGFAIFEKLE